MDKVQSSPPLVTEFLDSCPEFNIQLGELHININIYIYQSHIYACVRALSYRKLFYALGASSRLTCYLTRISFVAKS
jgi:hypothetical protein